MTIKGYSQEKTEKLKIRKEKAVKILEQEGFFSALNSIYEYSCGYAVSEEIRAQRQIEYFLRTPGPNCEVMIAGKTLKINTLDSGGSVVGIRTCEITFQGQLVYKATLCNLERENYEIIASDKIFLNKDWIKTFKIFYEIFLKAQKKMEYEGVQESLAKEQNDLENNYDLGSFEQTPKNKINNYIEEKKEKYQTKKRRLFNEFRRRFKRLFVGIMVLVTLFIMLIIIF